MKQSLLYTLFLVSISIYSQNWSGFNPNFNNYYVDNSDNVHAIDFDSISISGNDTSYFNYKIIYHDTSYIDSFFWEPSLYHLNFDSWIGGQIICSPNEEIYINIEGDSINFQNLYENQITFFDSITFNVTTDTLSILGSLDSIKTFTFQNHDPMILSKSFGWVKVYAFRDFTPENIRQNKLEIFTLIGTEKDSLGWQNFGNSEIFDRQIGSEFHYSYNQTDDAYYSYKKENVLEVISKERTTDSLIYSYKNCYLNSNHDPTFDTIYSGIDTIYESFEINDSSLYLYSFQQNDNYSFIEKKATENIINKLFEFHINQEHKDSLKVTGYYISEQFTKYQKNFGITYSRIENFSPTVFITNLIYSENNDKVFGSRPLDCDSLIMVDIKKIESLKNIDLTLLNNSIIFNNSNNNVSDGFLIDMQGRILLRISIPLGQSEIQMNEIPPGMYILKVENEVLKFIKP